MSSPTLPYLQRQLKPRLLEFAQQTNLQGYKTYNKSDLAAALDDHLRANQSRYSRNALFEEFYSRLARSGRAGSERTTTPSAASPRRSGRKVKAEEVDTQEETEVTTENESPVATPPQSRRTVARTALNEPDGSGSPLSPRVVTDAIDQQTARMRQHISDAWESSGMIERAASLRSALSSVKAIETMALIVESIYMTYDLVPLRYLTTVSRIDALHTPEFAIKVPDLFILVNPSFWAPYSLWLLTSLLLPLGVAYWFNLSLKAAQNSRGRTSSRQSDFDPLSFNIAKALIAYKVYADGFTFWGVYSPFSVARVNAALPGQWGGVLTGALVGVVGTLYEAILRK